jgi:hypothetical protein
MGKGSRIKNSRKARLMQGDGLKKRIKTSQQKSKGRRSNIFPDNKHIDLWFPKDGPHIVDIIPYLAGKSDPATDEGSPTYTFEYQAHTRVGPANKTYICPTMYNKPCPICEHRQRLRDKDDERYKRYFPKTRNLYNIVCHDDKQESRRGVQVWDVPWFYFEKHLMAISRKPSRDGSEDVTINFAHPENGKSITFSIEPPKSKDDYASYVGHAFDDRNYNIDDKLLDQCITLDEIVVIASYEEIRDAFYGEDAKEHPDNQRDNDGEGDNTVDYASLLEELEDIDEIDELEDFVDDNSLEDSDFDEDGDFNTEKSKVKKYLKKQSKNQSSRESDKEEPIISTDELHGFSWVKLKKFIKNENIDIDLEDYTKDDIEEVKDKVWGLIGGDNTDSGKKQTSKYSEEDIEEMSWVKLKKLVKKEDLNIDIEDYDRDDIEDLKEDIVAELGID